jgi:cytochrome c551/c552
MPQLFNADRAGDLERWVIAKALAKDRADESKGDHRRGRGAFTTVGCVACHFLPEEDPEDQPVRSRHAFTGLADRYTPSTLASFLRKPRTRYPDGRMPEIVLAEREAQDLAAYLLHSSKPSTPRAAAPGEPASTPTAAALMKSKRCGACHPGLEPVEPVPIRTPGPVCRGPRFKNADLSGFEKVAALETHHSPVEERRRLLERSGCANCHPRDREVPPPLEEASSVLGGAFLQRTPFLRSPRLTDAHAKYTADYLRGAVRQGVSGVRDRGYSFRMPVFGDDAEALVQALAEADGEVPEPPAPSTSADAGLGPALGGFEGYSCVSCHVWAGKLFAEPDPGAIAPDLTSAAGRIRRDWFDRWLDDPARIQPRTPMPQIFKRGHPATLGHLLGGDAGKQKDALWAWLSMGKDAPAPKPPPPLAIDALPDAPLAALIPVTLPDKTLVESLCVLFPTHDLLVFDVGALVPRAAYTGARLLRQVKGRLRTYAVQGTPAPLPSPAALPGKYRGYERLTDGVRILSTEGAAEWRLSGRRLGPVELPPAAAPSTLEPAVFKDSTPVEGALERPGYKATALARPKTASGEDLVMPGAIAADPRTGTVFVASMKRGELFAIREDGRMEDYARGLFQEAYAMAAESGALYVLHRRNLTKITDTDGDGRADRFERTAGLPHGVGETYDYAYGLVRDTNGAWSWSYAPYANRKLSGSGALVRLLENGSTEEVAYGFRNPVGWCAGPEGKLYYTDNQGEWVATNKLVAIEPGRYFGFPNPDQKEHATKPPGRTSVWVPYGWARSINGATFDATQGRFGPFAGQFFLAELMYGGAIVRAAVETVNGQVQGSCFPFWGKGLLGPLTLAFDAKGRLWVGGITEPGWMAQPDRGAVFRIDFTGETPFEMKEIRALPKGFKVVFTKPAGTRSSGDAASYAVESWRYETTGSYGSPELDRTRHAVAGATSSPDGLEANLDLGGLVAGRVYQITAKGVRSAEGGAPLVHPLGAYTLQEIPE